MGGAADVAHLARPDEVVEGAQGFVLGHVKVRAVQLVEVDAVDANALEGGLAGLDDVIPRAAPVVYFPAHGAIDLGGDHQPIPLPTGGDGLADDALAHAPVVHIGGVDEVDAGVQGSVHDIDALRFRGRAAEVHGAQAQGRHPDAGPAQSAIVHGLILPDGEGRHDRLSPR